MKYCTHCGRQVDDECVICPGCGCYADRHSNGTNNIFGERRVGENISDKSRLLDIILCFFLGGLGIHKFYEGKIGLGVLYILTFGIFGIGCIVDFVKIACGTATDNEGRIIVNWNID